MSFAFKPLVPKRNFADLGRKITQQLEAQLRKDGEEMRKDFEKTTATWSTPPVFTVRTLSSGGALVIMVGTDNEVYGYVDKGTRPHTIRPRYTRALRFQTGYKAKTVPNKLASKAGGAFGPTVFAKVVHHPGTKARNFTVMIQKKWAPQIPRHLQQVIRDLV